MAWWLEKVGTDSVKLSEQGLVPCRGGSMSPSASDRVGRASEMSRRAVKSRRRCLGHTWVCGPLSTVLLKCVYVSPWASG